MPKINKKILIDLGILVILIIGLFPFTSSGSGVAPNTIGTTNDTNAILGTRQWKSFYAQGRFWVFYCTGGNWGHRSSVDGSLGSWTGFTTVSACYNNEGWNISLYFDETTGFVHYWRYTGFFLAGDNTLYRRGTPNTNGTIAWPTGEQTVYNGGSTDRYAEGNIAVDTDGYAFIWAKRYHTLQADSNTPWVFKNANKDGTWAMAAGPFQLNTNKGEWTGVIVPLTNGKMYAIYALEGSTVRGRLWDGSSWGAEETDVADYPTASRIGGQWGGTFGATARGDDVYFSYLRATTYQVRFNKRVYGIGWQTNDELVQDSVSSDSADSAPVITMKTDTGDVYVFWAGYPTANHIYYRKRTSGGTWDSNPTDWIDESAEGLTRNDKITGYFKDYNSKIGLVYQTGTSPWNIKFAALDFSADNVSGWAWSENIGWISFNNTTGGGTTNYRVNINPSTGIFSGYAWSRGTNTDIGGVGWISFADFDGDGDIDAADKNISGSPCAPNCEAKLDFGTKQVSGWARALTDGGGWDGWIKLRGVTQTGAPYGVFWNPSTQEMEGWAWSDMVIGWISFNRVNCDPDKNGFSNGIGTCPSAGTPISNYKVVYGAATYTLTVSKGTSTGLGTVTSSPAGISCGADCSEVYNSGTDVTLTAVATIGSTFTGWSGGGCSGTGTCVVTMSSSQTVTATFNLITYTLTVSKGTSTGLGTVTSVPAGISCGADCSEVYNSGTDVTLTAVATIGSTFTGWSGGGCSGTGTCVVTMSSSQTVTATFNLTVTPPTAAISCDATNCGPGSSCNSNWIAYNRNCIYKILNQSTPDNNIKKSIWSIFYQDGTLWGEFPPSLDNPGTPENEAIYDLALPTLSDSQWYYVKLYVEDSGGLSSSTTHDFYVRREATAAFECSLKPSEDWKSCDNFRVSENEVVYFRSVNGTLLSRPSEGASSITSFSWTFEDGTPSSSTLQNPSAKFKKVDANSGYVTLTITDDVGRTDTTSHQLLITLPFPRWEEIPPF